jgi:hypothetical protein
MKIGILVYQQTKSQNGLAMVEVTSLFLFTFDVYVKVKIPSSNAN